MIDIIKEPWPWYVAGPMITMVMYLLLWFGKQFGISSNLRTVCAIGGAGKFSDFFRFDWKSQIWNLVFVLGGLIGGFIASKYLMVDQSIGISDATISDLKEMGFAKSGSGIMPAEIFSIDSLTNPISLAILILGGFLVGFGTRYAGGCTSGHAISGLSNLQLPSLIAVIGFFIGGLTMNLIILPLILNF